MTADVVFCLGGNAFAYDIATYPSMKKGKRGHYVESKLPQGSGFAPDLLLRRAPPDLRKRAPPAFEPHRKLKFRIHSRRIGHRKSRTTDSFFCAPPFLILWRGRHCRVAIFVLYPYSYHIYCFWLTPYEGSIRKIRKPALFD